MPLFTGMRERSIVKPWNFFKILFVFYLDHSEAVYYYFFINKYFFCTEIKFIESIWQI